MHLEAIELKRRKIFRKLKNFPNFYLVGGTALALQMGHRVSVDFDLFSEKEISRDLLSKVKKVFKDFRVEVEINNPERLTVKVGGTTIDFVKYPFPLISGFLELQGIKILKIEDISAMKAYSIGRRPILKDYVDLYFILKGKHLSLERMIDVAEKKYKNEFNKRLFLEQIVYLKDIEDIGIHFLEKEVTKKEIQDFFEKEVKKIKI